MDSQDHRNPQHSPGGGKSHGAQVCTKCGWNYPNPHPSARNRRAHKKICGTIKGYELLHPENAKHSLGLQEEQKTLSPRADERTGGIGDTSEEDVFTDAVCEFSCSLVSDSIKGKEEDTTANCAAKITENSSETQQCNSSSIGCVMKISHVVQESCEVPTVKVIETYGFPRLVEPAFDIQRDGESSMVSETLIESSQDAQVIRGSDAISTVGLETDCKGNLHESESKLASALGKREDALDLSWNDEVIYSDVEGPHGFASEVTSMLYPGEADYIVNENVMVDTSAVKANAAQVMSTSQSVPDVENADVSLHEIKGLEEFDSNHSVNPCLPETLKGEKCESGALTQTENMDIQPEGVSIGKEVTEPQGETALVAIKEFPSSAENKMICKIDTEGIKMKAEEGESSFGAAQEIVESETLRVCPPVVDPKVAYSNADLSCAANRSGVVDDLIGHESELSQTNVVAGEVNSPNSKLSSESPCAAENFVSPVSVGFEGDDTSYQRKPSTETSRDEVSRESSKGGLVEESSYVNVTKTKDDPISHSAPDDTVRTANQMLLDSGRTEFHRVVGGLGVIQGNEMDGKINAQNFYAEVPVTLESNDRRDFGRLQNLSEAHIRSLVSSPLVTRNNTSHAFETVSGVSGGVNKLENASSLAVALSKNQEITMEKTTSWSTVKEQHVPLKNLLSEARSPKMLLETNEHESKIPRVSSILDQETSPEDERRDVSEEWNSPAKYPVDLKREERKAKGRPFWVPFVCCSSVN